jgi:arylsulfatase A
MLSTLLRIAVALIALFAFHLATRPSAHAETPNIVILYADDMGYGDLGVQNADSKIPTPALDRLAREGTRFCDAHSSSGICTPSRYALLTGRYHWRKFHQIVGSFGDAVLDADRLTLPEMLKKRGYDTGCIGKWHLGWNWKAIMRDGALPRPVPASPRTKAYWPEDFDWTQRIPEGPTDHGFDSYFGDDVPNFPPYAWIEDDRVASTPTLHLCESPSTAEGVWETRPGPMCIGWQLDQVMPELTRKAVDWIRARRAHGAPFFLYFPFTSPHAPIAPTAEFQGSSKAGGYGDFMTQTDATVGAVLDALDECRFRDNTIVVFASDNGPEAYAWARVQNFAHESMGPLRGLKRDIWEGGHRVPMIVRWPGRVPANRVSEELISQIDLMATLAEIVSFPLPTDAADDSLSQLALWMGNGPSTRTSLVHNTYKDRYAIRSGRWLLVAAPTGAARKPPSWFAERRGYQEYEMGPLLFDLSEDLGQTQNLAAQQPEKVAELLALLRRSRDQAERSSL